MRCILLALPLLALGGCYHIRSDAEDQAIANAAATAYEAARAIEIGRAPGEPVAVIKDCTSAIAGAVGHPYPPPPSLATTTPKEKP